jgi:hypothetical protein
VDLAKSTLVDVPLTEGIKEGRGEEENSRGVEKGVY